MNYIYIIECKDGTLYTGWTVNIEKRLAKHNLGIGAKYTNARFPVILRYLEEHASKQDAMKREWEIKKYKRTKKLELCNSWSQHRSKKAPV
ncbi:MAG: GIY-YIG nuclease family protein [Eubacteriales bacterium]